MCMFLSMPQQVPEGSLFDLRNYPICSQTGDVIYLDHVGESALCLVCLVKWVSLSGYF